MLRNLTKGWNLYCHKHGYRNLNAYGNIYSYKYTANKQREILNRLQV